MVYINGYLGWKKNKVSKIMKRIEKINHKEREWFILLEIHGHGGPPVLLDTCLTFPFHLFSCLIFLPYHFCTSMMLYIQNFYILSYSSLFHVFEVYSGFHEILEVYRDTFLMRFLEKMIYVSGYCSLYGFQTFWDIVKVVKHVKITMSSSWCLRTSKHR